LQISSVESDIIVFKNLELSNFELPKFSKTHSVQIQANPRLESFSMGSLETNVSITALKIFRNSALNSIEISGVIPFNGSIGSVSVEILLWI
jgi:hypothetical protein